jgi:predicted enzyme related to lactoylglutathione lyase
MDVSHNPVVWFEIYVSDMDRARRFYEAVLGATLTRMDSPTLDEMWAFPGSPEAGGANGALVKMAGVSPMPGGTLVYFACEDCAVQAARAQAAGGAVERAKFPIGQFGHIALVRDTEGNLVGLHSMR